MAKLDNGPPRGTRDFLPSEVARRESVIAAISASYARFGFRRIETPAFEALERLTSGQGGENEKLIYKILRRGLPVRLDAGTSPDSLSDLALRYDLTVPLSRFYANHESRLGRPFRALQIGPVWRAERPAKGRYRQFTQCDIDVLGESSVLAECELMEASLSTLSSLGIAPLTLRLNDRRLLAAVAEASGVAEQATSSYFVSLDKLDKIGWEGISAELAAKGFAPEVARTSEKILGGLQAGAGPAEVISHLADSLPRLEEPVLADLGETTACLERLAGRLSGLSYRIDLTIVRGMGYYTGQIFEIAQAGAGHSIAGGGRYDELLGRFLERPVPACGLSIGFERVVDLAAVDSPELGVALLHGREAPGLILQAAAELRDKGHAVSLFPRRKSLGRQLDALFEEGYRAFALVEEGSHGELRPLAPQAD